MITTKRTPNETRRETVRGQFRDHAIRQAGIQTEPPTVTAFGKQGRARRSRHYANALAVKA